MELEQFFLNNINKILEYLDQDILTIYIRKTVDALVAGYFLMNKFADTAQLRLADWPPESGICLGFRCGGFYMYENEVGVEGSSIKLPTPLPISYIIYKLARSIISLNKDDILELYLGIFSWLVDNCTLRCEDPVELVGELETRRGFSLPFPDKPLGEALSLLTLPLLPGVLGRGIDEDKPLRALDQRRMLDVLDEALGRVYEAGFYPAIADKGLRYIPTEIEPTGRIIELEALLAGFTPDSQGVISYVDNLTKILDEITKSYQNNIINISNTYYIYKLMNYLPYFSKLKDILILRADIGKGFVASLIAPLKESQRLRAIADRLNDIQYIAYDSSILVFVPRDRWPEVVELIK
ncbi:hypothetical protein TUZN_0368 [Thermoproteus uzoniensis 768-20]|uniref:Uncharacterized protein n=1 Tax=Thermoproteus uzoniensis (strain 768-20) TaxID=999630 RepID=F2L2S7_THEU7|nr:hypothetical protein [Thermoproteus uzoniensis]AEA11865.1 hypothetical protein TUZN_0368 [Thermoproteus uzoniensis 768-20]